MRKDFGILETKERELNEGLSVVDQKTSLLLQRDSEIKSVESKFDKIENLILDLSERHKQISLLQKRIEDLKTDTEEMKSEFESLLGEADEKFEKLSAFLDVVENSIQSEPKKGRSRDSSDMIKKKKATVIHLHDNFNWSSDVIAEKLNMEKSLVETILNSRAVAH
ncbi:MAG: hypothetical protein K8R21_03735 [Leptospira sp.]|nr:hypothetical protein [Leptospira sp.]